MENVRIVAVDCIVPQRQEKLHYEDDGGLPVIMFREKLAELRQHAPEGDLHFRLFVSVTENDDATRSKIAESLAHRCNNCYARLPGNVGCSVHSPGWNWVTSNFGPFCDDCFKESKKKFRDLGERDGQGNLRTASDRWPDGAPT